MVQPAMTVTGTTPRLPANAAQTQRPTTMPRGTPTTIPTRATVVVCHVTDSATCRRTKPRALSSPTSLRRRTTLTTSTCSNVATPKTMRTNPKSNGKFTACPKLTRLVGGAGRYASEG